jgi:hypothetical protein
VVELILGLGEDLIFGTCLGVNAIALVLNRNFTKHGCHWRRWLGGIYSLQPLPSRWLVMLAMGTPDSPVAHMTTTVHCLVRATSARPLGFGAVDRWNPCPVAAPDSPVCSDFSTLTFAAHCSLLQTTIGVRLPLLRWLTGHVWCTLDSLVNYSRAPLGETWEWLVRLVLGLVHQTLSGVAHSHVLLQILLSPQLKLFLSLCWTLCTWDKWDLGKLVWPRGLWWSSTTKIDYRKWLGPFPF